MAAACKPLHLHTSWGGVAISTLCFTGTRKYSMLCTRSLQKRLSRHQNIATLQAVVGQSQCKATARPAKCKIGAWFPYSAGWAIRPWGLLNVLMCRHTWNNRPNQLAVQRSPRCGPQCNCCLTLRRWPRLFQQISPCVCPRADRCKGLQVVCVTVLGSWIQSA